MHIKSARFPKRIATMLTCLLLLLSMFTQLAYAAWVPPVANGSEGVGTGGSLTSGTFNDSLSGYRVSIISRTGEMVKPPQDFLFSDRPAIAFGFSNNKWGHSTGGTWKRVPTGMPKPVVNDGTTFQPNGLELRKWLMDNNGKRMSLFISDNFYGGNDKELAAAQKDIKIIFEPVFFWRLQSLEYVTTNGKNGKAYATTWKPDQRVYGTITEISQFSYDKRDKLGYNWNIVNGKQSKGSPIYGGNIGVIVTKAGPNALITSEKDDELGIDKAQPTGKMLPPFVTSIKNGIGLHIYGSPGAPPEPGFPTWGEGPIPEPAPDPKTLTGLPKPDPSKPETAYKYNVVKTYRDKTFNEEGNEEIKHVGTFSRTETPGKVIIQDEPNYKVKEWFISSTYNNPTGSTTWEDNHSQAPITGSTGKGTGTAEIKKPNTTLYVLLEKQEKKPLPPGEGDLVIEESQVTKAVETMTSSVTGWGPQTMTFKANDISGACPYIFYHSCEDCSYSWQCSAPYVLNDRAWNYNHKNTTPIDGKIHADGGVFKPINDRGTDAKGERDTVSEYTNFVDTFNYKLVVWRGEDVPTIANYKEQSSNPLNTLVKRYGKEPAGQRYSPYSGKGLSYNRDLLITLDKDGGLGDYTTTSVTDHGYSKSATHANINTLNYDTQSTVKVYYGKAHEKGNLTAAGTQAFTTTLVGKPSAPKYSGGQMKQSGEVTWYPYIRMTYQTTGVKDPTRTNVNILSQYISELTPNDYVEAAWVSTKDYNMNLKSAQWSLHSA